MNRMRQQKNIAYLLGLLAMMFCLLPQTVSAVTDVAPSQGSTWDQYVETHADQFKAEAVKEAGDSFSTQEVQVTKGLNSDSQRKKGRSQATIPRYTVLTIDTSGSMSGLPMKTAKAAASKFVKQMLAAKGENYIALVGFSSTSVVHSQFTDDADTLEKAISRLAAGGGTATNQGLLSAAKLFDSLKQQDSIKNIVVLSDGEPQDANAAITVADKLTEQKQYIYSLGFFHNLSGASLERARTFMDRIQNAGYYDVTSTDELEFEFDKLAEDITSRSNIFKYPSADKQFQGSDSSAVYYYHNDYFKKDAYQYNEQLATMSLSLALSAFGSSDVGTDYQNKSNNAQNLLSETGFKAIKTNDWFTKKPEKDSIGVIAGQKEVKAGGKSYTLIALAIRGGGYESEWASNVTLGKTGNHQGFSEARDQVLQFLTKDYIEATGISGDIKIWVTGFSRAAATANLVAGKLDEGVILPNCQLKLADLYAYTFETPAGALSKKGIDITKGKYKNIYNTINKNDPVPRVAPKEWGFERFGEDHVLPSKELISDKRYRVLAQNMKKRLNPLVPTTSYLVDDFAMTKINWPAILPGGQPFISNATQSIFLDDFIKVIANESLKNRTSYAKHYQETFRKVFASMNGTEKTSMMEITIKKLAELLLSEGYGGFKDLYVPGHLDQWLKKILSEEKVPYEVENLKPITSILKSLQSHPIMVYALVTQTESLMQAHFPELCLAWLQSQDTNYVTGGKASFVSGNYRIIRINCPVDIQVYNDEGTLVSAIINNEPQQLTSLVSAINENGEKLLYLPPDGDYTIKTTATADGKMTYTINEYSYAAEEVRKVQSYYDLPLEKGKTYSGDVPAYSAVDLASDGENGTDTVYTLKNDRDQKVLTPSLVLVGEQVVAANVTITVTSQNETQGIVFGGGDVQVGNFVQVIAAPNDGCVFNGWYQDDTLVSSDMTYRFRVSKAAKLVARFNLDRTQASKRYHEAHGKFDPEKKVVEAGDWQTFIDAYRNESVTKIVLTTDITDTSQTGPKGPTNYKRQKSLEIDGQQHMLTLKQYHSLQTSDAPDTYTETLGTKQVKRSLFHMHDMSLRQNLTGSAARYGAYSSLSFVGAADTGKSNGKGDAKRKENLTKNWYFRFGNIDTKKDDNTANSRGVARLVTAYAAEVTLYGELELSTSAENMYVGSLIVEAGTKWTGVSEFSRKSLVWFVTPGQKEATGVTEALTIGEGAQISLRHPKYGSYYPAFYGHYRDAVIKQNAIVDIEMRGTAWRFDQSGSNLTIKDGASLNLVTQGNANVLQFGSQDLSAKRVSDCSLKVEPGGGLFVTGSENSGVGTSVIDFSGNHYIAKNCLIELDQPKAFKFANSSKSKHTAHQSVLNLRDNTNRLIIKQSAVNLWKTTRQWHYDPNRSADQQFSYAQHFELFGLKGNRHSRDVLAKDVLKANQINRISN